MANGKEPPSTQPASQPPAEQPKKPVVSQPVQPKQAAVSKPASSPAQVSPQRSKTTLLLSFVGLFFFLFVLFMIFLVVLLLQNGGNNPVLQALGVEPILLQQLLQTIITLIFGFLSLIALIVTLVGLFRWFTSAPAETEKKKKSLVLALVAGGLLFFSVFVWIMLYFYISRLQLATSGAAVIVSDPENTINLTAPVDIVFSANQLEALYAREGIVAYSWDLDGDEAFDDGNGRDIRYTYEDKGNSDGAYNVAVKVVLGTAQEVVVQKLVTIANVLPKISVQYEPKKLEVPLEVSFDASATRDSDGSVVSYSWDFDADGVVDAQGAQAKHLFTEPVATEVLLRVTDNNNGTSEEKISLNFQLGQQKQAVIVVRPGVNGQAPFKASFDASNSFIDERVRGYEWDFGDNTLPVQGRLAEHEYKEPGTYTVRLRVEGESGARFDAEQVVTVERLQMLPTALIQLKNQTAQGGVLKGEAPLLVDFDASGSSDKDGSIIEHRWDFDADGQVDAVGPEASYTFGESKTYEVTLTVTDNDNLVGTAKLSVQVTVPEVLVDLQASMSSGSVPLEVTFDASNSRAENSKIISYTWDFGDDGPEVIGSARQTHVYNQVGEYTATVVVLTEDGKRASRSILIVAREVELQAEFTLNPAAPTAGQKVFFDASLSQGQISRYYWEFGDGTISRVVKPDHAYETAGSYTVKLEVYDRNNRISRKEVQLEVK